MEKINSIQDIFNLSDPLTQESAVFLANYKEEDTFVDYKLTFENLEKEWLELTKDISAFANTHGGFLLYGIKNNSKEIIGLSNKTIEYLKDANHILQKINRNLEPQITSVRTKPFQIENKKILVIFIPQSIEKTHMISKDGEFTYPRPSKQKKVVLKEGTFYVRHSAKNNLANAGDLEDVIKRRILQFRDSLLDKIVKVAESPVESKIKIIDGNEENGDAKKVTIDDSPDATPIKGIGFTATPEGLEQEIAAFSALSSGRHKINPPDEQIWEWYLKRDDIKISEKHLLNVFKFSLTNNLPSFYWIQKINTQKIQPFLLDAIKQKSSDTDLINILRVAAALGKGFYGKALLTLGKSRENISPRLKTYSKSKLENEFSIFTKKRPI